LIMHIRQPLVLGLFDCDPDGVKILDVYRSGSKNLAHERAYHVPEMRWIGLKPEDVFAEELDDSATLPLTKRDMAKIKSMLISDVECSLGTGLAPESRSALQWMRMLNRKAEIQILEDMPGGMRKWVMARIEAQLRELS
jgi:meiotic recombination protein SPO11